MGRIYDIQDTWITVLWISFFSTLYYLYITTNLAINSKIKDRNFFPCPKIFWSTKGLETVDDWVAYDAAELYYYSAYLDNDKVVLIGLAERRDQPYLVTCRFFDIDGLPIRNDTHGAAIFIPEDHGKRYAATFIYCQRPSNIVPHGVALVSGKCLLPIMYIPIRHAQILKRDFTVCVSPLQLGFDKAHELVEMIELNRILGADYFFFYNYSASPNIDKVLEHYSNRGLVKIIQWRLPFPVTIVNMTTEEIHYYGQLAVINDCVYRNKGATSFVVNQDIDEFIIPRKQNNWNRMVNTLPTKRQCYMIRSAFFRKDWPDVNQTVLSPEDILLAQRYMSVTILKQVREDVVFPAYTRSKWMARPECIEVAGVHNIHSRDDVVKCKTYVVLLADGLLHHYRSFEERVKVKNTTDSRISILKDDLLKHLERTWSELGTIPEAIIDKRNET